jgi:hypothetical protein
MTRRALYGTAGLAFLLLAPGFAVEEAEKPVDVAGQWEMTAETPVGNFTSTMKLERKGDQLTGATVGRDGKETKLNDIKLTGKTLTFTEDASFNGEEYHLVYTGTVEGDSIKGTFQTNGETMSWSAKRVTPTPAASSLAGTWKLAVQAPDRSYHPTITLSEKDGQWSGKLVDEQGNEATMKELTVKGNQLGFVADLDRGGMLIHLKFSGAMESDRLKGTMLANDNTLPTTGERPPKP